MMAKRAPIDSATKDYESGADDYAQPETSSERRSAVSWPCLLHHTTLAAIAQELEARGVRTPAGRDRWAAAQASRLLAA
jgi:hypothetical protein